MNIGILGAGRIGSLHADNLVKFIDGAELVHICDPFKDNAQKLAQSLGVTKVSSEASEVFNDPNIQAVMICSSTDTHSDFIRKAALAGKHIFCEKPIDFDQENIKKTLEIVKASGKTLQIGFNRRFDKNFAALRQEIKDGKIGAAHSLKITSRDPSPPPVSYIKVSGGLFNDMTIHDFDMARFIMGEDVVEVFAKGAHLVSNEIKEAGDIDSAMITLKFKSGALGIIDNSRQALYGYDQRIEAFGEKGCLFARNEKQDTVDYWGQETLCRKPLPFFFLERYRESYIFEINEFLTSLRLQRQPSVTGEDGLEACRLAIACNLSMKENRAVLMEQI